MAQLRRAAARVKRGDEVHRVVRILLEHAAQRAQRAATAEEQDARTQLWRTQAARNPELIREAGCARDLQRMRHGAVQASSRRRQKVTPTSNCGLPVASQTRT